MNDQPAYSDHIPVMLNECLSLLNPQPGGCFADGTLGAGGHSAAIAQAIGSEGHLTCFDLDPEAIKIAKEALAPYTDRVSIINDSYVNLNQYIPDNSLDGFMVDLGVSSMQLDHAERGFSFHKDGPLDMRFSPEQPISAADIVNTWNVEDLSEILWKYGEERKARQIAAAIVRTRAQEPITTTGRLRDIVMAAAGNTKEKIHPATRSFQGIRIAVNGELDAVEAVLPAAVKALKPGGRLVVISFHSLEDRIVKQFFKTESRGCLCPPEQPVCTCGHKAILKEITRHPVTADEEEIKRNPRSRSAKVRAAVKTGTEEA